MRYAQNQEIALRRFLTDGRLPMDNNWSERELRRQAVGRKNWLFVGSDDGGNANATFTSLLASCQLHDIEPWTYLRDLFCLFPGWPKNDVLRLAPAYWVETMQTQKAQDALDQNLIRFAMLQLDKAEGRDAHGGESLPPAIWSAGDAVRWTSALLRAGYRGPFSPTELRGPVVVHDPCSARFGVAGRTSALELLRAAGVDARPFSGATCCGGAEPFRGDAPALSEELGRRAAAAALAAGAKTFVTSDAGCLIQFRAAFGGDGAPEVAHLATALLRLVEPESSR